MCSYLDVCQSVVYCVVDNRWPTYINYIRFLPDVRSEYLTCTFRASCCSARLSRAQVPVFVKKGGGGPALVGTREYKQSDRNR